MPSISVILITKNEAANLDECLSSVAPIANEIIVVDSGSDDDTVEIARRYGAIVVQPPDWPGYGPQKNRALVLATREWVLSIDADERVTKESIAEIKACLNDPGETICFALPRLNFFRGKFIRHCGWYPDYVNRLIKRGSGEFSDRIVHETLIARGPVARLKHPLLHYSFRTAEQVEGKIRTYSSASAQLAFDAGKRASWLSAPIHGAWSFVRTFLIRLGFLDGWHGVQVAVMSARSSFQKQRKLYRLAKT